MTELVRPAMAEAIRAGLWGLRIPIPDNPLGYTLVYLLDAKTGPVLVDTGWDDDASWEALVDGVRQCGFDIGEIYGVLSTHHHHDHDGLAGRVREASGAWVAMYAADARFIGTRGPDDAAYHRTRALLVEAGRRRPRSTDCQALHRGPAPIPFHRTDCSPTASMPRRRGGGSGPSGRPVTHRATCASRRSATTSSSQATIYCPISARTSAWSASRPPGIRWGTTWRRCGASAAVREVLPAHQPRFADNVGRAREILRHHDQRLASIVKILTDHGPSSAWQIAEQTQWNPPWSTLSARTKSTALTETYAHLRHLEVCELVRRGGSEATPRWSTGLYTGE